MPEREVLIYDWNKEGTEKLRAADFRLLDTTLRDGVQPKGITQPTLEEKLAIIDADARVGIEAIDICLPSDPKTRYFTEGVESARYIREHYPGIETVVLARTMQSDIDATLQFAQDAGSKISVILFRGTSDLRLLGEDWNEDGIIQDMSRFTKQLVGEGLKVICATEDTTRTRPEFLREVFKAGFSEGASEFCVSDTVGYSDPQGIINQLNWLKQDFLGNAPLQYHGHRDTGMATANSMAAIEAGVRTIHVTWTGVGERAGNTPVEEILANLERRGIEKYNLLHVVETSKLAAKALGVSVPSNLTISGENAFGVESGIHAAGIHNALQRGLTKEAGIVYSAIDPARVGRQHEPAIGPLGGRHSVEWVLDSMGIASSPKLVEELLRHARVKNCALTPDEIERVVKEVNNGN